MTAKRDLKKLIRERMKRTGESYASARRVLLAESAPQNATIVAEQTRDDVPAPDDVPGSELDKLCERLRRDSNALSIILLDEHGRQAATAGGLLDASAVKSFRSASGKTLTDLIADKELSAQFAPGSERTYLHLALVAERATLAVLFDERSSLGLVRLRVKKAAEELARLLARDSSGGAPPAGSPASAQIAASDEAVISNR